MMYKINKKICIIKDIWPQYFLVTIHTLLSLKKIYSYTIHANLSQICISISYNYASIFCVCAVLQFHTILLEFNNIKLEFNLNKQKAIFGIYANEGFFLSFSFPILFSSTYKSFGFFYFATHYTLPRVRKLRKQCDRINLIHENNRKGTMFWHIWTASVSMQYNVLDKAAMFLAMPLVWFLLCHLKPTNYSCAHCPSLPNFSVFFPVLTYKRKIIVQRLN